MARLLVVWLVNTVALLAVAYLMPSVRIESPGAARPIVAATRAEKERRHVEIRQRHGVVADDHARHLVVGERVMPRLSGKPGGHDA